MREAEVLNLLSRRNHPRLLVWLLLLPLLLPSDCAVPDAAVKESAWARFTSEAAVRPSDLPCPLLSCPVLPPSAPVCSRPLFSPVVSHPHLRSVCHGLLRHQASESVHEIGAAMGGFFMHNQSAITAPYEDKFFEVVRCVARARALHAVSSRFRVLLLTTCPHAVGARR